MTYQEAKQSLNNVRWRVQPCPIKDCWCAMIFPEEEITCDEDEEVYVIGSGEILKSQAEHIVEVHNKQLEK